MELLVFFCPFNDCREARGSPSPSKTKLPRPKEIANAHNKKENKKRTNAVRSAKNCAWNAIPSLPRELILTW